MRNEAVHHSIIDELYGIYQAKGFVSEDAVLDALAEANIPLYDIDCVCDQLLSMGVIIRDDPAAYIDEDTDEEYDRSRTDYELLFAEVISIDESLAPFIEQIQQIQPPQHREWGNLMPQVKGGNQYAYQRIIEMYLRTVVKISLSYYKKFKTPLAETIQEGCIGLLMAVNKFEIGKQDVFPTYFPLWVRQNIQRETPLTINPTIYCPVHIRDNLFSIWEMVEIHECDLCEKCDACPNLIEAIMNTLECTSDNAKTYLWYFEEFQSVEDIQAQDPLSLSDHGFRAEDFFESYNRREIESAVAEVLDSLTPKEKQILQLRFGLHGGKKHTLEQVSSLFGVTRERIRQIEAKAIRKLQQPMRIRYLKPFWSENKGSTLK